MDKVNVYFDMLINEEYGEFSKNAHDWHIT